MNHTEDQIFWEYFDYFDKIFKKKHGENIDNPSISKQNVSFIKIIFKKN